MLQQGMQAPRWRAENEHTLLLLTGLAARLRELRSCSSDRPCSFRMPTSSFALGRFAGLWSRQASINCATAVQCQMGVTGVPGRLNPHRNSKQQAGSTCAMEAGHSSGTLRTTRSGHASREHGSAGAKQDDNVRSRPRARCRLSPYRAQAAPSWAFPSDQLPQNCAEAVNVDLLGASGAEKNLGCLHRRHVPSASGQNHLSAYDDEITGRMRLGDETLGQRLTDQANVPTLLSDEM